jgi:hypothetical protein
LRSSFLNILNNENQIVNNLSEKLSYILNPSTPSQVNKLPGSFLKKVIRTEDRGLIRDRPFNLKGGLWFFVSFRNFFSDNTRVRIFIYFVVRSANFFFQNLTLGYMTKTLDQINFVFPPPKSEYFFQQHWELEYFFRKKTYSPPHFKLNGRSLTCLLENVDFMFSLLHVYLCNLYNCHKLYCLMTIKF